VIAVAIEDDRNGDVLKPRRMSLLEMYDQVREERQRRREAGEP
jgi:hypothetical protein